jgi:predicted kinase
MPKCVILIGVAGAGKSTWISQQNLADDACVISTDNIIQDIAHQYGMTYNEAFKDLIGFAEKVMWHDFVHAYCSRNDIYIDRTNMSAKSRKKFIDRIKKYNYLIEAVDFETPEKNEWERRLNSRQGKTIPQEVLDRMINSYEIPLESEGFDNIIFIKNSG